MKQFIHTLRKLTAVVLPLIFLMFTTTLSAQGDATAGEGIFKAKCASCHNMTKDVTGPALIGILDGTRAPSREWLKLWIKDNNALRASGDDYANKVYEAWGGKVMTAFPYFSDNLVIMNFYLSTIFILKISKLWEVQFFEVLSESQNTRI